MSNETKTYATKAFEDKLNELLAAAVDSSARYGSGDGTLKERGNKLLKEE